ncbi:hypothetical protein EHP00_284 [Ecytonucleospora hepatopenaei]|uniref:Uncharacterized protein n=1 Tax=Ecytonucleospora hepatopenaei TaxID=646526 RepID=A0A1W0E786_9MICR|nr:hypothetical protein EHP00_284 [Ecytonucleospora hepatopenaei]
MLKTLNQLVKNEQHEEILQLDNPDDNTLVNKFKGVACIKLGMFKDALIFLKENTYEKAYCFYKLRNYKKSLKVLRKIIDKHDINVSKENLKHKILVAQCLYYLDKFYDAFEIYIQVYTFLKNKTHDFDLFNELLVNISACESLNYIASQSRPSMFACQENVPIKKPHFYAVENLECKTEVDFNLLYKHIEDEDNYMCLLQEQCNVQSNKNVIFINSYFSKQLATLNNQEMNCYTKKQKENFLFNTEVNYVPTTCELFQKNFYGNVRTEYNLLKEQNITKKECFSKRLVLKYFVKQYGFLLKSKSDKEENKNNIVDWAIKKLIGLDPKENKNEIFMLNALKFIKNLDKEKTIKKLLEITGN